MNKQVKELVSSSKQGQLKSLFQK